ncbi:MAG: hypothetical protein JXB39_11700 [Deltaproteobacteria bacterium]|nr:hypothetical protein [Deltaproteobacteria bacterium]
MNPHPDAATFWEHHLEQAADDERALAHRHDRVGLALAAIGGGGSVATALVMQAAGTWGALGGLADLLAAIGLLLAALAAVVAGAGLAPMDGRTWRPGSLAAWIREQARRGFQVEALAGLFPDRADDWRPTLHRASRVRDDLAAKVRAAREAGEGTPSATSPDARRVLAEYLEAVFHTDLSWWLEPASDTPEAVRRAEARVRLVFWFWTQRQAAQSRAEMVRFTVRLGTWGAAFLGCAFAVHLLGWWILLLAGLGAGLAVLRVFLGRSHFVA